MNTLFFLIGAFTMASFLGFWGGFEALGFTAGFFASILVMWAVSWYLSNVETDTSNGVKNGSNRKPGAPSHGGSSQASGTGNGPGCPGSSAAPTFCTCPICASRRAQKATRQSASQGAGKGGVTVVARGKATASMAGQMWVPANDAKPVSSLETKLTLGELLGWRAWRVKDQKLHSMFAGCPPWEPGVPMTAEKVLDHDEGNPSGVHSWKNKRDALQYAVGCIQDVYNSQDMIAVGQVEMWGDVVEHEKGYRAQFAYIHSIDHMVAVDELNPAIREQRIDLFNQVADKYLQAKANYDAIGTGLSDL